MLAMRGLKNAQDLKTVHLYGRGWGLDLPEAVSEDVLVDGLWLFDYLHAMDLTSISLISYASAQSHPNLDEELAAFRAYLPDAAGKTAAYYENTTRMLAEARANVNRAAAAKAAFNLQTVASQKWPGVPDSVQNAAGDGFRLGWAMPVRPTPMVTRMLGLYGYGQTWMLQKAREAGVDFIRAWDANVFDWSDVEKQQGQFDWSKVDDACKLLKQYDLGLLLKIPSDADSPPEWLVNRLGDKAVLVGVDGKRIEINVSTTEDSFFFGAQNATPKKNPMNVFNPEVAAAFGAYAQALLGRVKQNGVEVVTVELVGRGLPWYGGDEATARFREWLKKNKIDTRKRWGADYDAAQALLPAALQPTAVADPAKKRMAVDVVGWREQEYIDYFRPQVQAIRAVAPDLPICVWSSEVAEANESMAGRHNERLVRELGLVPLGMSMENIWDNLRRAYSPAHFSAARTHSGTGDAFSQYACTGYAHDSLVLYSLPHVRGFNWGESLFYPDLRWEFTSMLGWHRFQERAQAMAPEMLNTRPAAQAAILWSDTAGKFQSFIEDYAGGTYGFGVGPANYHKIGCIGWARICDSIGLTTDMVTEDQARAGGLEKYRLLIMPSVQALPGDVAEKVRQYVAAGGIAIATSAPALYDQEMEQKGPGQLADVFGADFESFLGRSVVAESPLVVPRREDVASIAAALWRDDPAKRKVNYDTMQTLFCTWKPRDGANVLESFTSGKPAVILNSFGKGQALAIGYPVGRESFLANVYHQHYGNNWPDLPQGPIFQQNVFYWVERLLRQLSFKNDAVVAEEIAPRSTSYDANYPEGTWPRATQRYRDYFWQQAKQSDNTQPAPRAVDLVVRGRPDNPTAYLEIQNREGTYGLHPGALEFEASSKLLSIDLNRADVTAIYDVSLGCAVPFEKRGGGVSLKTMIEPSMCRMLAVSNDNTVRLYSGNRKRGGLTGDQLLQDVKRMGAAKVPESVVIGADQIKAFLAERMAKGVTISCEQPSYLPAANRLAEAIRKAGGDARITRNSPRIGYVAGGYGHRRGNVFGALEEPDIILGNRDESHYVASFGAHPGRGNHTARLPIMTSLSFPGPGRCAVVLTRPFIKQWENCQPPPEPNVRVPEKPAPPTLVIGASDVTGLSLGVDKVIGLIAKK